MMMLDIGERIQLKHTHSTQNDLSRATDMIQKFRHHVFDL